MKFSVLAQEVGRDESGAIDFLRDVKFDVEAGSSLEAVQQATEEVRRRAEAERRGFMTQVLSVTTPDGVVYRINMKKRWSWFRQEAMD